MFVICKKEYRSYGELRDLIASKLTIDSSEVETLLDLFSEGIIHKSLKKWAEQGSEAEQNEITEIIGRLPDPDKIDYSLLSDSELLKQIIESFNQEYTPVAPDLRELLEVRVLEAKFNEEELTISSEGVVCPDGDIGSLSLKVELKCKKWLKDRLTLRFSVKRNSWSDSVDLQNSTTHLHPVLYNIVLQEHDKLLLEAQWMTESTTQPEILWSRSVEFKKWQVGDYYNVNGKEGVVFWVDESGEHGKIVSMTESGSKLQWSSDENEQQRLIGADNETDGAKNMAVVKQIPGWQSKYPAFKWCADLGEGWYLPAIEELKRFTLDDAVRDVVNRTLAQHGGKSLPKKGAWGYGWSSTEESSKYGVEFCAWLVSMTNGSTYNYFKSNYRYVRAVSAF